MISSWKVGGINDSWWLAAFRKVGSNSHIIQKHKLIDRLLEQPRQAIFRAARRFRLAAHSSCISSNDRMQIPCQSLLGLCRRRSILNALLNQVYTPEIINLSMHRERLQRDNQGEAIRALMQIVALQQARSPRYRGQIALADIFCSADADHRLISLSILAGDQIDRQC